MFLVEQFLKIRYLGPDLQSVIFAKRCSQRVRRCGMGREEDVESVIAVCGCSRGDAVRASAIGKLEATIRS